MRKAAFLLISVAVIFIFVGAVITQSLLILQRVAAVREVSGMVWVKARGQEDFKPLADAARVAAGDQVKTGERAGLTLNWLDGTRIRVGEKTVFTVLKCQINTATKAETAMFKLDMGRLWIRVLKALSHKSKFEIRTPTATAGVRGTIFSVAVTPAGKTLVSVKEGKVAVDAAGQASEIAPGQMAQSDAAGSQVAALDGSESRLWQENQAVAGPDLAVRSPADGETIPAGVPLEVKGRAELEAKLQVNGVDVPVLLGGNFRASVPVKAAAGETFRIDVVAIDRRGYETRRSLNLPVK